MKKNIILSVFVLSQIIEISWSAQQSGMTPTVAEEFYKIPELSQFELQELEKNNNVELSHFISDSYSGTLEFRASDKTPLSLNGIWGLFYTAATKTFHWGDSKAPFTHQVVLNPSIIKEGMIHSKSLNLNSYFLIDLKKFNPYVDRAPCWYSVNPETICDFPGETLYQSIIEAARKECLTLKEFLTKKQFNSLLNSPTEIMSLQLRGKRDYVEYA